MGIEFTYRGFIDNGRLIIKRNQPFKKRVADFFCFLTRTLRFAHCRLRFYSRRKTQVERASPLAFLSLFVFWLLYFILFFVFLLIGIILFLIVVLILVFRRLFIFVIFLLAVVGLLFFRIIRFCYFS